MDDIAFRDLMAVVPAPVTVITTLEDGVPVGTTVSAFTSLSLSPRLILVSLDNRSDLLRQIRHTRRFGVNLLAEGQGELAMRFARTRDDRFGRVEWRLDDELPRLDGVAAWIVCGLAYELPAGDHTILAGEVSAAELGETPALVYSDRAFGGNSALTTRVA